MSLLELPSKITKVAVSLIGLLTCIFAVINLINFLSAPNFDQKTHHEGFSNSWSLFVNMLLLSIFILQHSAFAAIDMKNYLHKFGLQPIYRSIYVTATALALQLLTSYWRDIPDIVFWKYNLNYRPFWWLYTLTHTLSWTVIFFGSLFLDVTELLGMKQVYYNVKNLPDPNLNKSASLTRLITHMRHPSFLAFLIIFWTVPLMSVDRFLLATIFTLYMYFAWNTDQQDYTYHQNQYLRKYHELERSSNLFT